MRRINLLAAVLVCVAGPAFSYDPCFGPRQAALDVQGTREREAKLRDDFATKIRIAPIGTVGQPDRDAALLAEYRAKAAIAAACAAAGAAEK